jgi:hypothetical protein
MSLALSLLAASALAAAPPPGVSTGAATQVTRNSARLNGIVSHPDPDTTYRFEYGTSTSYGSTTPPAPVRNGGGSVNALLSGLEPTTSYHYRLLSEGAAGTRAGADRAFTTRRPPIVLQLEGGAHVVPYGSTAVLTGSVLGAGDGGLPVKLLGRPFPSDVAPAQIGPAGVTSPAGGFGFRVPSLRASTEFHVETGDSPPEDSHVVRARVAPLVTTRVRPARPRAGAHVRFSGTVRPARDGASFALQKRTPRGWATVAGGVTHHARGGVSTWGKTIVLRRGGQYRVFVRLTSGTLVSGAGAIKSVHLAHR